MTLALKTDGPVTTAWIIADQQVPSEPQLNWESERRLSDELLTRLKALIIDNGYGLNDLSGIIIFSGPGSFTSLRIGHTVVNALCDALNIPVVGADGKDWIRRGLHEIPDSPIGRPAVPKYGAEANITKPRA